MYKKIVVSLALALVPAMVHGCGIEYDECKLTYTVDRSGLDSTVEVTASGMRLSKFAKPTQKASLEDDYKFFVDEETGLIPQYLANILAVPAFPASVVSLTLLYIWQSSLWNHEISRDFTGFLRKGP